MKNHLSPPEWVQAFDEFVSSEAITPPRQLSDQILGRVAAELNPSPWKIFAKLAFVHLIAGTATLLFCPQFGLQLAGGNELMGYLMHFGEKVCMLGCGAEFVVGTALVASIVLRPEEVRTIRKTELLQFAAIGLLSLGAFVCFGTGVVLSFALFWLLGSVIGGIASFEFAWAVRAAFRRA